MTDKLHFIAVKSCVHLNDIIKKVRKPSTSDRSGPLFLSFLCVSPSLSLCLSFHLHVSASVSLSPSLCLCLSSLPTPSAVRPTWFHQPTAELSFVDSAEIGLGIITKAKP